MPKLNGETLALGLALALVGAFVLSFATGLGLRRSPAPAAVPRPESVPADPGTDPRGRIEVLNASRRAGQAREATAILRRAGFDVVFYGNASAAVDSSIVLDRSGQPAVARSVANELGIARVESRPDSTLYLEATVVIGADWSPRRR